MKTNTVEILVDASPILMFFKLLQRTLEIVKTPLDLGNFPSELVRFERDSGPAETGKLMVRLYPSDRFLDFAAAIFARDLDLGIIKKTRHHKSPKLSQQYQGGPS